MATFWLGVLTSIVAGLVFSWSGVLARLLVERAARRLPEGHRDDLLEDWLANLELKPDGLSKLCWALPLVLWGAQSTANQILGRSRKDLLRAAVRRLAEPANEHTAWAYGVMVGLMIQDAISAKFRGVEDLSLLDSGLEWVRFAAFVLIVVRLYLGEVSLLYVVGPPPTRSDWLNVMRACGGFAICFVISGLITDHTRLFAGLSPFHLMITGLLAYDLAFVLVLPVRNRTNGLRMFGAVGAVTVVASLTLFFTVGTRMMPSVPFAELVALLPLIFVSVIDLREMVRGAYKPPSQPARL
jgi:hypothetical protein